MKRILLAMALAMVLGRSSFSDEKQFRAGAFVANITPEQFPVSSNGNFHDVQATEAHDPLSARCLVLDDGSGPIVFVVCDSCMIPREVFDKAKEEVRRRTGILTSRMMMSATHTHEAVTLAGVFQSDPQPGYAEFLIDRVAVGVEKAWKRLEPAQVAWGSGSDPSQVFNRRWFTQPGIVNEDPFGGTTAAVRTNPGVDRKITKETSGPTDPEIGLLAVRTLAGKPIAVLANYSLHYVGGVPGLSADYFGEFARRFASRIGADQDFVAIMSNGTSGNINNVNFSLTEFPKRQPFEQIEIVATSVADAAFRAYEKLEFHSGVSISTAETEVEMGVRRPSPEEVAAAKQKLEDAGPGPYSDSKVVYARETVLLNDYPAHVSAKLQAFRIGDLGIVSSPCETFVETGLAIKKDSPLPKTFCIELANGYNGYLPTPEHHNLGGYETWRARSSYVNPTAEPLVRETLIGLLKKVETKKD